MKELQQAIILAAGPGTRLQPYTDNLPKTLLNVGNLTIFDRIIRNLQKVGIKDIVVVTGHGSSNLEWHISTYIKKLTEHKLKFEVIRNDNLDIGNMYSFWLARDKMTQDFIILDSDIVFHPRILDLLLSSKHESAIVVDDTKQLSGGETKVKITKGQIVKKIRASMDLSEANGEYVGIMKVSSKEAKKVLRQVKGLLDEGKYPLNYPRAFSLVANEEDCFFACITQGLPWIEIDTVENLQYARQIVLPYTNDIEPPAYMAKSDLFL